MNKRISLLLLCLGASLALNLYFLSNTPKRNLFASSEDKNVKVQQKTSSEPRSNLTITEHFANQSSQTPPAIDTDKPNQNPPFNQTENNRAELLAQANLWLTEHKVLKLGAFLQSYLKQYPQDMDFLLLEAKLKLETTLLSDAIIHYYDLLRKPMTSAQHNEIEQQIEQLSKNTIKQLRRNYSWDILAMFVEPLLQLEPNNRLYILSLAMAYAELFQEGLMENVLASLDFNDPDAQRIRNIIVAQQISPVNDESDESDDLNAGEPNTNLGRPIPLKQFGDQYVVAATLSSNPVALLIDTGASVTAISKQYFDNLSNRYKINYLGRFSIGTAGGSIMAPIYQFQELTINHVTVQNLPVVILPMRSIENADGLLGMNFLREFDFKIDQRQSIMFIK
ncbi:MAG: clan AA aspartic protease (TIGR02281 family) [Glaciecola sp.]|jgi:clan AA aspartic protease (TIGR02281 family)